MILINHNNSNKPEYKLIFSFSIIPTFMLCSVWKDHPWLCSWGLITPLYVECTVSVGVRITQSCSLLIHIIFFTIHRRLDTDHTERSRFPSSSWQQGLQTTNQSPLSLFLQAHWLASLQPVVECPSLTFLMPCAFDGPFIYYFFASRLHLRV